MASLDTITIVIRKMSFDDIDRCLEIEQEAFGRDAIGQMDFVAHLCSTNLFAVVAEIDSTIVGFMQCQKSGSEVYISNLAVDASARKQGVGERLIVWLQEQLSQLGRPTVRLHVSELNEAARRLYARLGFVVTEHPCAQGYPDGSAAVEMRFGALPKGSSDALSLSLHGTRRN